MWWTVSGGRTWTARRRAGGERAGRRRRTAALGAVALLAGAAPAAASPRTVLLETFGSVDCASCPAVREAISPLEPEYEFRLVAVEYAVSGPLAAPDALARHAYYGSPVEGTALFDGGDDVPPPALPETYRARIEAHLATPPPLALEAAVLFSASAQAGSLQATIEIDPDGTLPDPGAYRVRALFLENGVAACCGPDGAGTFDRVVRSVLPERPVTVGAPGQVQFEQWAAPLDPAWEVTNLRAVVWLQRDSDRAVAQAALAADAGSLQPLPVTLPDESRVTLHAARPNPLRTGETRLLFTLPAPASARVQVLDVRGRVVRVLTDGPRPGGIHHVRWDGTDFRGRRMADGVYVVRLETSGTVRSRKLTLVR